MMTARTDCAERCKVCLSIKPSKSECMKSDDAIALGFDYPQNTQLHIQEVLSGHWLPTYPEAGNNIGYNLMAVYKILGIVLER
jgi:hypothetical protein